jgi:hypothetical protein
MHRNGHVREQAVRLLADGPPNLTARYLLLRIDDWVEPVRHLAASQVRDFIESGEADALVSALPAVWDRFAIAGQEGRAALSVGELRAFLRSDIALPALERALQSGDRWQARLALPLLLERKGAVWVEFFVRGTDDLAVAVAVARACLAHDDSAESTYGALLESRFGTVRAMAAFWALRHAWTAELEARVLRDSSASVREQAQRHLQRTGRNPRTWYVEQLAEDRSLELLVGLSDVAIETDEALALLESRSTETDRRVAAAAILGRTGTPGAHRRLVELIGDPVPRVSRMAARALHGQSIPPASVDHLLVLVANGPDHVASNTGRLLYQLPRWRRLIAALELSALDGHAAHVGRAVLHAVLQNWQRSSTPPTPPELAKARSLAEKLTESLGDDGQRLRRELTWER